ncbi:hypothetical protein Tco_0065404 [Tanacetum coccineum]
MNEANELNQEDSAEFDGNTLLTPYDAPNFDEAESSTTTLDPSNMHEFHQVQPSTHIWTKTHPLEQVIGDPSKPEMTRKRLHTDLESCKDDCISTSGSLQFLGEMLVSWSSKKQDCTAMSTAKAEYVSLSAYCTQVIWMRTQLLDYGYKYNKIPINHHGTKADVHQDELCPLNKRYALMDANKKIDLVNPLCPNESKIIANILQNHPLRFSIAASSLVPWIYLEQLWHTLKEDGSKYRLKFVLDRKYIILTLNDFRRIFQLPQATDNNHERFVIAPKFSEMVSFFLKDLGFTLELRSPSNFKTIGLIQPWQTLGKMFARCLTTRATSHDQPPLQIMQMLYCFVNNVHVDYAELFREGLHYSLEHPSTLIPYPRFTKLIVAYYMTAYPEISRRVHDKYHNFKNDNSMYAEAFGVDVPMTQSQPIVSTQETHRTPSAPRTPNPNVNEGESSAQQSLTIIKLRIPPRRSTRNTPPTPISTTPISTAAEVEDITLRDTIQLSIDEQKSRDDLESQQNVEKVKERLVAEEIEKMVEGTESEDADEVDNSILNSQNDLDTRLDPGSYKESLKVEKTAVE